jgi:hypothetical protein
VLLEPCGKDIVAKVFLPLRMGDLAGPVAGQQEDVGHGVLSSDRHGNAIENARAARSPSPVHASDCHSDAIAPPAYGRLGAMLLSDPSMEGIMKLASNNQFVDAELEGDVLVAYVEEQSIRHAPSTADLHKFVLGSLELEGREINEIRIWTRGQELPR